MTRRLINLLTALSLLLCIAAVALWVRSYWHYDALGFWPAPTQPRVYGFISDSGTLFVASQADGGGGAQPRWLHSVAPASRQRRVKGARWDSSVISRRAIRLRSRCRDARSSTQTTAGPVARTARIADCC